MIILDGPARYRYTRAMDREARFRKALDAIQALLDATPGEDPEAWQQAVAFTKERQDTAEPMDYPDWAFEG